MRTTNMWKLNRTGRDRSSAAPSTDGADGAYSSASSCPSPPADGSTPPSRKGRGGIRSDTMSMSSPLLARSVMYDIGLPSSWRKRRLLAEDDDPGEGGGEPPPAAGDSARLCIWWALPPDARPSSRLSRPRTRLLGGRLGIPPAAASASSSTSQWLPESDSDRSTNSTASGPAPCLLLLVPPLLCLDSPPPVLSPAGADDGGGGRPDSLLTEHFVDLVNTLLLFVSGPHDDLSTKALESLVKLSDILAGGMVPLAASTRRKVPAVSLSPAKGGGGGVGGALQSPDLMQSDVLMLWWPLLLGLSQTLGDPRNEVRVKGLTTLLGIINKHFFPSAAGAGLNGPDGGGDGDDNGDAPSPQRGDLQTLQLIFRGILVPALEFEEMDGNSTSGCAPELLPPKFVHLATVPPSPEDGNASSTRRRQEWIGTTFEHLVDGCVALCIKSLGAFGSDPLVEECLAMLNSCLLSDSGHLAVRGLRRLLQFVTKDLNPEDVTDDTWATVCHMLFRVLSVRGLPPSSPPETEGATDEQREEMMRDHAESMDEFVREQRFFSNRRYIGCNAAMVIGSLLTNESIVNSMGVHWYIFLTNGLGKGIKDWERAAEIMDSSSSSLTSEPSPPHYLENVLYARRWMTKFLLSLMTQRDVSVLSSKPCQQVLRDESGAILQAFVSKEVNESSSIEMRNISKMVSDLLDCFSGLSDEKMATLPWLSPVLSTCIQTNNVTIRTSVQILLTRLLNGQKSHQGSSPG
mmetsp:Transcript_15335/g.35066  ORF Transcript_15335/g.35066 Transcript_15335/m.35066 type:complete len:744 (-) Transcript_15335:58-2289(-)